MDSWSDLQIKKMEAGGNRNLNSFLSQYGIPKETDIITKYNSNAASIYRDRIQALAEGRSLRDPPVVKENANTNSRSGNGNGKGKPPLAAGSNGGWDDNWGNDNDDGYGSCGGGGDFRRNQSTGDVMGFGGGGIAPSPRSKSTEDIYTRTQLEASAANKEGFFAKKMAMNGARPEGLPPSQGGKYVGFGSSPNPSQKMSNQSDYLSVVSEGIGKLSMVAQSATKEITSKVQEEAQNGQVELEKHVITKTLTKPSEAYYDAKNLPHVLVSTKICFV